MIELNEPCTECAAKVRRSAFERSCLCRTFSESAHRGAEICTVLLAGRLQQCLRGDGFVLALLYNVPNAVDSSQQTDGLRGSGRALSALTRAEIYTCVRKTSCLRQRSTWGYESAHVGSEARSIQRRTFATGADKVLVVP